MIVSVLTWLVLACWVLCLWWMHRASSRHNALLSEPPQLTHRFEQFSEPERNLGREGGRPADRPKASVQNNAPVIAADSKS